MGAAFSDLDRTPGAGLTKKDVDRLRRRFQSLSQGSSELSVSQFELIPELAGNPFLPRLFEMFDGDKDGRITIHEFNNAIEFFLKMQNSDEKARFVFTMYDLSGSGFVTDSDLFTMLKRSAGSTVSDNQLRTIVSNTIQEYDKDRDGRLSFAEFEALVSEQDIATHVLP